MSCTARATLAATAPGGWIYYVCSPCYLHAVVGLRWQFHSRLRRKVVLTCQCPHCNGVGVQPDSDSSTPAASPSSPKAGGG